MLIRLFGLPFFFLLALLTLPAWALNSELQIASTTLFHTYKFKDVNDEPTEKCEKKTVADKKGQVWGKLCAADFKKCKDEGACLLQNDKGNTLVNIDRSGSTTFDKIDQNKCAYGTGSQFKKARACLIPYKTIACAPQVPVGTVIYIREAVGKHYAVDGGPVQVHDGNFICGDRGKDISGGDCRVDVFTGFRTKDQPYNELELALRNKTVKNHCAKVIGGKLADDDKLISNLQALILTNGKTPAAGSVADNGGGSPTSASGAGAR